MKMRDHVNVLLISAFAAIVVVVGQLDPLPAVLILFGFPIAYLLYRKPYLYLRPIVPSLVLGLLFGISFEYVLEISNGWYFPRNHDFTFPNFFLNTVPGDALVWYVLWVYFIVLYYEYFFDKPTKKLVSRKAWYAIVFGFLLLCIVMIFQEQLRMSYVYAKVGALTLVPVLILYVRGKFPMKRLLYVVPVLGLYFFGMELIGLTQYYWNFSGEYIATVPILSYSVPLEELVLWIVGSPAILVAYHELFIDDER